MPIEINYFAWEEKWTPEEERKAYYNPRYPIERRLKSGHCVASILYREGLYGHAKHGHAIYEFLSEDVNKPISILSRICFEWGTYLWDAVPIPPRVAREIGKRLAVLTPPRARNPNIIIDTWLSENRRLYSVTLDQKYNNLQFRYDTDYDRAYAHADNKPYSEDWIEHVDWIIDLCEDLTGNKRRFRDRTVDVAEDFRILFWKKSKHIKYQGNWRKPKSSEYYSDQQILAELQNNNLTDNLGLQVQFKFYLPSLMKSPKLRGFMFQKLAQAKLISWDEDEMIIVQGFFSALWENVLLYYPSIDIDSYTFIYNVQLTGVDATRYIKYWKSSIDDISASRHLAGYVQCLYEQYVEDGIGVFETVPKILRRWLREIAEGDYFLKRYMEYDGVRPFADEFAEASEMLSLLRTEGF